MHISKLIIKGFRSFSSEGTTIEITPNLNVFIGINSSGKTATLEALRKLFGLLSSERELVRQDFHLSPKEDASLVEEKELSIEVKIEFEDDDEAIPHYFETMVIGEEGEKPYIRIRLEGKWERTDYSEEGIVDAKLWFVTVAYGEQEDDTSKKQFPNRFRGLIQVMYVPAIRKPTDQIKYVSGSLLYRVLRLINFDGDFKDSFEKKVKEINTLFKGVKEFSAIQDSLTTFWQKFHKDERYKNTELGFSGSDLDSILKKLEISFNPTELDRPYHIGELGEGYRSLFYLTLVCALLEVEEVIHKDNPDADKILPELTILAIEEPENHIAPQLLGRVVNILLSLSSKKQSQVFLSSHTPAIVKRIDPESIYHFRITKEHCSEINKIVLPDEKDEAFKYIKEAVRNYPEIYFAKMVVIGEGDSEEVIFNRLMSVYNTDFDDKVITFAPLGHRFVNHIWRLLKTLNIPYVTLLDLDVERNGGGWGRIKYILQQLITHGEDRNTLLKTDNGVLSDKKLSQMHTWGYGDDNKTDTIMGWVNFLEGYDVFYSAPLDLDFLMLENYSVIYEKTVPDGFGPNIPDKLKEPEKFKEKVESSVQATLKSKEAKALTYSEEQKELMIWYNYHFLGRGKPVTHINALAMMTDREIEVTIPEVFERLFDRIQKKIEA